MNHDKIAIVGAGRVGSTFAYTLAASGLVGEVLLVDADAARAEGEAMDIAHAAAFHRPVRVRAGTLADTRDALLTVITAGAAQQPDEPRTALFRRNLDVLRGVLEGVLRANPDGLLLVTTNPVDALTCAALRLSGLPSARVIGSGTVLDSARLRSELALQYGVDPRSVHAYVLGEHGDSEFVAWSTASIGNLPLAEYGRVTGMACAAADLEATALRVRNAAYEIIRRKGATNFAIAAALWAFVPALEDESQLYSFAGLIYQLFWANLVMGIFNLQPVFPMDGGRILRALLATRLPYLRATAWAVRIGKVIAVLGMLGAIFAPQLSLMVARFAPELGVIDHPIWMLLALYGFIFFVGELEYRAVRRREVDDAHWRAVLARTYPVPPPAEEPPVLTP